MIHILEKNIADKIAAGEVIDRPVSIVKELLENALDAGADTITVEIRNGGKSYIRVTDNGCGIQEDDTELAFKRHATSKISSVSDLEAIHTLGFRGEALASICAVSRTELITKTDDAKAGRKVVVEGSETLENIATGCPEGTTVTVRDLFYNVPARRKFLSSDNAEARRITDMVSRIALSYGDVRITLINGAATVFSTSGKGKILNNIIGIYGSDTGRNLLPVESKRDGFLLKGFVSTPAFSVPSRNRQIFCVNGRVVSSKVMERALEGAYREKLFQGRFPIAFLFLSMPAEKLDVNIHPTKKEVRFDDDFEVEDFINKAVRKALSGKDAIPKLREENILTQKTQQHRIAEENIPLKEYGFGTSVPPAVKTKDRADESEQVDIKNILTTLRRNKEAEAKEKLQQQATEQICTEKPASTASFDFDALSYLGVLFRTYIIAADQDSFYLIDQHAAHERIFYEKLLDQYHRSEKQKQQLLMPLRFQVAATVTAAGEEWIDQLDQMGYDVEDFGSHTYIVREIPAFMEIGEAESFLSDFFQALEDNPDFTNQKTLEKIIMRSCKSAVKGGDHLGDEEILALMEELKRCINPFSCPHGRPTFIRMTKYEIEKMFKRV